MPSSKKTTTSSNQTRDPWAPAQGNLRDVLSRASTLSQDSNNFRPQITQTYNKALDRLENLSEQPNHVTQFLRPVVEGSAQNFDTGQDTLRQAATGQLIGSNPFLDDLIARQQANTANLVNQQFSAAGRYGSGAHTGVLTDKLGGLELGARFDDYNNERTRQLDASRTLFDQGFRGTQLSGQLDNADLADANLNLQVGGLRNSIADANNQADLRATEWLNSQTTPIAQLGGTSSGTQVTSQPTDRFGQALGAGMMGMGLLAGGPAMGGLMSGLSGLASGGLQGAQQGYAGMHNPGFWPASVSYA